MQEKNISNSSFEVGNDFQGTFSKTNLIKIDRIPTRFQKLYKDNAHVNFMKYAMFHLHLVFGQLCLPHLY